MNQYSSNSSIGSWVEKFGFTGSALNHKLTRHLKLTKETINRVKTFVKSDPGLSICKWLIELAASRSSLCGLLVKDLKLHSYKILLMQNLKLNGHDLLRIFDKTMLRKRDYWSSVFWRTPFSFEWVPQQSPCYRGLESAKSKHQAEHSLKVTPRSTNLTSSNFFSLDDICRVEFAAPIYSVKTSHQKINAWKATSTATQNMSATFY